MKNIKKKEEQEEIKAAQPEEVQESMEKEEDAFAKEIAQMTQKAQDLEGQLKHALADYQNLEKRSFEERREWIMKANKELILRLIPVLDILMLAAKHIKDEGLNLSIRQFLDVLDKEGVKKIETKDKTFDPLFMECTQIQEGETDKVLEETRIGFHMGDQVLRPAQVIVGKEKN